MEEKELIGKWQNIHTFELYEYFLKDIKSEQTKTKKATIVRNVPHLRLISSETDKTKEPFRVNDDFNKFNTFIKIK